MVQGMKDFGEIIVHLDMDRFFTLMVMFMKAIGKMTWSMDSARIQI